MLGSWIGDVEKSSPLVWSPHWTSIDEAFGLRTLITR